MAYQIKETREFYDNTIVNGRLVSGEVSEILADYFGEPETFAAREAAQARIDDLAAQRYTLSHGESARPTYKIVKAK